MKTFTFAVFFLLTYVHGLTLLFLLFIFPATNPLWADDEGNGFAESRKEMVTRQIQARGVDDPDVLRAMSVVPRHLFVPIKYQKNAYGDYPLPIGKGQTISQPYIVAFMTALLHVKPKERILEIGTGSGYQAAVLAELGCVVYSIEVIDSLGESAKETLDRLGYGNVHIRIGDGHKGWPEKAPFDAIIVTCAPEKIPPALIAQLKERGRLIIPVGESGGIQHLVLAVKKGDRLVSHSVLPVRFVPMVEGPPS
ncbi:MAG: protein-L-isoaspartate(D-aspartate) O-methyltransferase [Deltaproteobacteria bacterium]|nr:protein-L-isoaspartate(D-aspartate) O-methyltransferase [Deltaproteobacteria bacterium]